MPAEIFGRDAELRALADFAGRLAAGPGAVVLTGRAGAGKTTLLRAGAAMAAERGITVLRTAPSHGDMRLAFAGLTDLLEARLDAVAGELPPPQARALRVALLRADVMAAPPEPRVIAAACRSALAALARSSPVLVVVDDVQWLDAPTGSALGFAVRRLVGERIGLLCAQRADGPDAALPLELDRAPLGVQAVPVGPMSLGALHRMLRSRLGATFPHPVLRRIEATSGGNPFIALEIGRALARRGGSDTWPATLPVPATLAGLVGERLSELPAAVLAAVQLAAVMPGGSAGHYLAAGVGGAELDAAVTAGVLESDAGRLRFSHPLLASAVAATIPPARRRELHAIGGRLSQRPEERARHRALSADGPSAAVAAELDQAARATAARGAPDAAAELFELAASLTPDGDIAQLHRRRLAAARQFIVVGAVQAATGLLERLAAAMPPGPVRAVALNWLGWLRQDTSVTAGTALLEQALAEAGEDTALRADIHVSLCDNWSKRGDKERALAQARLALADAERSGDDALLASCQASVVLMEFSRGAPVDEELLRRALRLERELELRGEVRGLFERAAPSWVAGFCHLAEGRLDEAEAEIRQVLAWVDADGLEYWRADLLLRLSLIAGLRGDPAKAAELAAAGLDSAEQIDSVQNSGALLYAAGEAALRVGQEDVVHAMAERGAQRSQRIGDVSYLLRNQALPGSLAVARGDYPAAASRLRPLAAQWRETGERLVTIGSFLPDAVEALAATGDFPAAAAIVAAMQAEAANPFAAAVTARCQGWLAAAQGSHGEAIAYLGESLRRFGGLPAMPVESGRTLLMLGGIQRRLKQRGAARAALTQALELFEGAAARLWAERARAERARVSGRSPGPVALSVTEERVADLVARGLSNRDVAAELFVTVRTVESTLTKVYAKLGVRSRTELTARLRGGPPG